jgi:hypothetical protein
MHTQKQNKLCHTAIQNVCYRQQVKNDWLSDDAVYRTRGETTGGLSCTSACVNLVLNPTVFVIGTLECTEGNVYSREEME